VIKHLSGNTTWKLGTYESNLIEQAPLLGLEATLKTMLASAKMKDERLNQFN
jgi:hypothetical protein